MNFEMYGYVVKQIDRLYRMKEDIIQVYRKKNVEGLYDYEIKILNTDTWELPVHLNNYNVDYVINFLDNPGYLVNFCNTLKQTILRHWPADDMHAKYSVELLDYVAARVQTLGYFLLKTEGNISVIAQEDDDNFLEVMDDITVDLLQDLKKSDKESRKELRYGINRAMRYSLAYVN